MSEQRIPTELRAALRQIASEDAPELIEQARGAALARARKLIEDGLVQELVREAAQLGTDDSRPEPEVRPNGQAWWAYCVLSADDAASAAPQLQGIEPGTEVEVVSEGGIAALVSPVPLAEYGDQRLREHLEDIEWVERTARAHEAVLDQVLEAATLVPLRLCTLYHHREGIRRFLADNRYPLIGALDRTEGCAEWGLKLFADPGSAQTPSVEDAAGHEAAGGSEAGRSGSAYLAQRRRERSLAELAGELRARCAETIHDRLSGLAKAATVNPPQRRELHGRDLTMILNAAYLVPHDRVDELRALVARSRGEWEQHGFVLELTGPWPAYNFVSDATGVVA